MATLRERSKRRLDDNYNAAMVTRALTGKGADKLLVFQHGLDKIDLVALGPTAVSFANGVVHVDVGADGTTDFDIALGKGAVFDTGDVILA